MILKPSIKYLAVENVILNFPVAASMAISASLLNGQINIGTLWFTLLGFVLAFTISMILPMKSISNRFAGLFKLNISAFTGRLVGNIAANFIPMSIISFVMATINIGFKIPTLLIAFLSAYPLLFLVSYTVSFLMMPVAIKTADKLAVH
jgi:hypothetical protein